MTEDGGWLSGRQVTLNDVAKHAHVSRAPVSIAVRLGRIEGLEVASKVLLDAARRAGVLATETS